MMLNFSAAPFLMLCAISLGAMGSPVLAVLLVGILEALPLSECIKSAGTSIAGPSRARYAMLDSVSPYGQCSSSEGVPTAQRDTAGLLGLGFLRGGCGASPSLSRACRTLARRISFHLVRRRDEGGLAFAGRRAGVVPVSRQRIPSHGGRSGRVSVRCAVNRPDLVTDANLRSGSTAKRALRPVVVPVTAW